jgi:papain like protease
MPTPIDVGLDQLEHKAVVNRLTELRITTMEQLLPRIMRAGGRRNLEALLGVSLDGILAAYDSQRILAGVPNHHAATGALIPTGTGSGSGPVLTQPIQAGAPGGGGSSGSGGGDFPDTPWLPTSVDLSPRFTLPVRDQGNRLTCVAFSICAAIELVESTASPLAPPYLYWECKQRDISPWNTACGTFVETAIQAIATGLCEESDWTYHATRQACPDHHGPPPTVSHRSMSARGRMIGSGDLVAIKEVLASGHPVVASIRCFDWWLKTDFETGQITSPAPGDWSHEAHALCLVGYEDLSDGSGDGDLLFRNS